MQTQMSPGWLDSKPFEVQLIIVATVCDLTGASLGYALHPQLGVEPLIGLIYGLVAGTFPLAIWLFQQPEVRS
ncbi:hypothetical protein ACFQL3_05380 [Natronoarchaeum sp. GCM10025321]|uniref:hypothetical protein n=2 Tax=unclassified Natronoarchaeum TaxID=2620183 RepID=UPI00361C12F2